MNQRSESPASYHKFAAMYAPLTFAALVGGLFFPVLFTTQQVVAAPGTDLAMQFLSWREFGFGELRNGHLALWNPHIFGGTPYFAGFQSALLYPPNWLHLFLPVGLAINWIVAIHIFLAGYFTYLWCRGCGVGIGGAILAGVMFMFSGPYFLRLYAGHLPHLAVMVWTPLMLLAIDQLGDSGDLRWCFLGIAATAMHILSGHPQYVYYTGIVLSVYTALRFIRSNYRLNLAAGFVLIYVGAVLITAVQLFTGIQAASEFVRSGGTSYDFASTFSLPPENFLTLLVPGFFGDILHKNYWGANYLWECSLYVSISGLVMAILGAMRGQRQLVKLTVAMIVITTLLALGRHTPFYQPMFDYLPAYSSFRGTSKFAYLAVLFVSLLAGVGFDSLLRERRVSWKIIAGVAMAALMLALLSVWIWYATGSGAWGQFIESIRASAQQGKELFGGLVETNVVPLGQSAAKLTLLAAAVTAVVAILLWASRFTRWVCYGMLVLASVEMFAFAHWQSSTIDPVAATAMPAMWREPLANLPSDQRALVIPISLMNLAMSAGFDNMTGYDPGVQKRYAELIDASQGLNPAAATQYLYIHFKNDNIFRMWRCGLICGDPNRPPIVESSPLPTVLLVDRIVQLTGRDAILGYMLNPQFDASKMAVVESSPAMQITSTDGPAGTVRVVSQTTDSLELEAKLDRPAMLVVTNNYSSGWRATPIGPSMQSDYTIVPANYAQMGIALVAGNHHLLLQYRPLAFVVGKWVSIISLIAFIFAGFLLKSRKPLLR
jgi:hypothetical protein